MPLVTVRRCVALLLALAPLALVAAGPIYPDVSRARADIDAGLKEAAKSNRRVIVDFGGNWCPDCKVLDIYLHKPENAALLEKHYVLVHVNVGDKGIETNFDVAERYGIPLKKGVPALAILEGDGRVVHAQRSGEFESMRKMDPQSVNQFLTQWRPPAIRTSESTVVIHPAHMVDVRRGVLLDDVMILVEAGRITRVGPAKEFYPPRGATFIELPKLTVMPGLIDAHVHLAWGPAEAGKPLPGTDEARKTLQAGFTTVRNLGATSGADFALRDAIAAGRLLGPRMLVSGPGLGRSNGACDVVFASEGRADGVEAARRRTREILDAGADVIKLCAGGPVIATTANANDVEYGEDEIRAIVEEAHRRHRKVAAHAHGPAAIANAVRGGVDSIEHGGFVDAAAARALKERGVWLVPTIYRVDYALDALVKAGSATPQEVALRRTSRDAMRANIRAAIAAGVPIAMGTDATVIPHGSNAREIATLVDLGMTPAAAIRAATVDAAKLLGIDADTGAIEEGKRADLVAVEGNPLADVTKLQGVRWVMLAGRPVRF